MNSASSKIRNISNLKYKEKKLEYWGYTPDESRKAMVNKSHALKDKTTTLKDAVAKHIKNGINLGIGGFVNTRVTLLLFMRLLDTVLQT
ncbi:MAG: hypothetical protein RQM92_01680 [Candidatus Syntrophopropionicum ammoniitolerans]